jgi:lipopolysaccharide assembly outer membrane protein LptD (OstA)
MGCAAGFAFADDRAHMDEPFEITADRILFDDARNLYVAEGHVRVEQLDRRLKARWVAFSEETRIAVAEGDVQLDDGPDSLFAEFMVLDVDTLQGVLFQGAVDAGSEGFVVRAKELVRTGKNTFTVRDGTFTTCRCEPGEKLPWEIRSSKAEVEMGGYGKVTNSTFNVLGVPVLWIPWAFFPVKSDRETGFLLPSFGFGGRGGANFGLPFFWAAMPQLNVTLTPRYFAERGYKQDLELEYVFGERSEGQLFVAGLRDRQADETSTFNRDRWAVLWKHDQELPAQWRWQTDLKLASDNLYADDFVELHHYNAYRFIESTTNVARSFGSSGGYGAMAGARYADDVQASTFDDRDEYILQRFAEVRGDVQPGTIKGLFGIEARVDSELIHFSSLRTTESELSGLAPTAPPALRTNGRFYDLGYNGIVNVPDSNGEGDGIFEPGEPLAERGTRIVIHPRFARPFQLGSFAEFVPEIGWQQALYESSAQKFAERGLVTARADLRGRLARDYAGEGGRAIRHLIEPSLGWAFVSQRRQRNNPLFVPRASVEQSRQRTLSLENVTRNPSDRIASANQLVLSMGQRFFVRDRAGRGSRLRADIVTAVDWDFTGSGGGLGNLVLDGRLFPVGPISSRLRAVFNPETARLSEGEVGLTLQLPVPKIIFRAATLGTIYRYRNSLPRFAESVSGSPSSIGDTDSKLSQLNMTTQIELTARIRLSYRGVYSFTSDSGFIRNRGLLEYVSKCRCWGVGAAVFHDRDQGVGGGFEIRFLGLGDERSNIFDTGFGTGLNF